METWQKLVIQNSGKKTTLQKEKIDHDEIIQKAKEVKEVKKSVNEILIEHNTDIDDILLDISQTANKEELEKVFKKHYKTVLKSNNKECLDKLVYAKDMKKDSFVEVKEEVKTDAKDISDFFEDVPQTNAM